MVTVLLGAVISCGEWMRYRVDMSVRCINVTRGEWKSGVIHRSGKKKVILQLIFMHVKPIKGSHSCSLHSD